MESRSGGTDLKQMTSRLAPGAAAIWSRLPFPERERPFIPPFRTRRTAYIILPGPLSRQGYGRYEISNYAKPGRECLHNTGYWREALYTGPGACKCTVLLDEPERVSPTSVFWTPHLHLVPKEGGSSAPRPCEELTREAKMEFMFLGLRMTKGRMGIDSVSVFGVKIEGIYGPVIERLIAGGFLKHEAVWISLTEWGMDVSNFVLS